MAAPIFDARYVRMDALNHITQAGMPLLAARAGAYRERQAEGALSRLFHRVWMHQLPNDFRGRVAVVPDGCCDLIFAGGRLLVIGPDRVAAFPELDRGETVLGLRFRPGAALRWLDVPLSELVGQVTPLSDLRDDAVNLEELLREQDNTTARVKLLHLWAKRQAETAPEAHHEMGSLFTCLLGGNVDTDMRSGLSDRTLRRRANDHFGYGPKTLDRILRLQRLLRIVKHGKDNSLAMTAFEAGYADQAHMTRDVRELTTLTPLDIRRQLLLAHRCDGRSL